MIRPKQSIDFMFSKCICVIRQAVFCSILVSETELQVHVQVYLTKENHPGSHPEGTLVAIGGRYDYLLQQMWSRAYVSHPHLSLSLLH